jgi:hypothetical protein
VGRSGVFDVQDGGSIVRLVNGTDWQIGSLDTIHTILWLPSQEVVIVQAASGNPLLPYWLLNRSNDDVVQAARLQ